MKPYKESKNGNIIRRTFSHDVSENELVWHRDHEDRVVLPLNENDWMVQFDNELPTKLMVGEEYFIPKNVYHRVIKGSGDLMVEIIETNFDDGDAYEIYEIHEVIEEGKKKKKKDACYHKVRARYDVWPSAYASGALVKCRKVGAANWGNKSNESEEPIEEKWSDDYKKSIDCNNPKGFSQKAHCDARKKRQRGEETKSKSVSEDVGKSGKKQFKKDLQKDPDYLKYKDNDNEFGVPNVTTDDPFIKKGRYTRVGKENLDELEVYEAKKTDFSKEKSKGLHGWFERQGGKGKSKGWVDCNTCRKDPKTGRKKCKTCGRKDGEERAKYPACRPTPSACGTRGKGKKWGKKTSNENLNVSENFSIFDKNYLKMKLNETFNREEPMVLPAEPITKPKESPMVQPSRRNKPFLPERESQPDPKAEK